MSLELAEDLILNGDIAGAELLISAFLSEEPRNPAALHLRAMALLASGNLSAGIAALRQAVEQTAEPGWLRDLATACLANNQPADALPALQQAFAVSDSDPELRLMLAQALTGCGRPREAVSLLHAVVAEPRALSVLAEALFACRDYQAALNAFRRAAALDGQSAQINRWCVYLAMMLSRFDIAVEKARLLVVAHPDEAWSCCGLASALWCAGYPEECRSVSRRAVEVFPQEESAWVIWLRCIDHATFDPSESRAAWSKWAAAADAARGALPPDFSSTGASRLRVGYLVDEIYRRPNSYFIPPLVENHDLTNFEVFCYLTSAQDGDTWDRLQRLPIHSRDMRAATPEQIARQTREDSIDILVNVSWEFRHRHLAVFSHRGAPVQIELPHYPATTGLPFTDYILTDPWICPPGAESMYTETVRRLRNSYMPWTPPAITPPLTPAPALKNHFCTFGVFQKPAKLTSPFWDAVSEILRRLPSARLLIHQNSPDIERPDSPGRQHQLENLSRRDVDPARVSFVGIRDHAAHLETVAASDIALDTFPYNGTTTTGDCLWMGVPVIALVGATHAGRVSYSMLSRLGLQELAAHDPAHYADTAVALAQDRARLQLLRAQLRSRMSKSVLTDARAVMSGIEVEYKSVWKQHRERESRQ